MHYMSLNYFITKMRHVAFCRGIQPKISVILHGRSLWILLLGCVLIVGALFRWTSVSESDVIALEDRLLIRTASGGMVELMGAPLRHALPELYNRPTKPVPVPGVEYCHSIRCSHGTPCEYPDEVDLRIIVLTYNRPASLEKNLRQLNELDTLGHAVRAHVWIDRSSAGVIDDETVKVAQKFAGSWSKGRACVHTQDKNVFIGGQWANTWRPKRRDTTEMAIIVEDDIDLAPMAYRWLLAMRYHYGQRPDIMGYTLQMEDRMFFGGKRTAQPLEAPNTESIFSYPVLGTWGYSPVPGHWRDFQDWYNVIKNNATFRPYVPGILVTEWFKTFEAAGKENSMWEMWYIYFCHQRELYCVYSNLQRYTGRTNVLLCSNRQEKGLHYSGVVVSHHELLLKDWSAEFASVPAWPIFYTYDGTSIRKAGNFQKKESLP